MVEAYLRGGGRGAAYLLALAFAGGPIALDR